MASSMRCLRQEPSAGYGQHSNCRQILISWNRRKPGQDGILFEICHRFDHAVIRSSPSKNRGRGRNRYRSRLFGLFDPDIIRYSAAPFIKPARCSACTAGIVPSALSFFLPSPAGAPKRQGNSAMRPRSGPDGRGIRGPHHPARFHL